MILVPCVAPRMRCRILHRIFPLHWQRSIARCGYSRVRRKASVHSVGCIATLVIQSRPSSLSGVHCGEPARPGDWCYALWSWHRLLDDGANSPKPCATSARCRGASSMGDRIPQPNPRLCALGRHDEARAVGSRMLENIPDARAGYTSPMSNQDFVTDNSKLSARGYPGIETRRYRFSWRPIRGFAILVSAASRRAVRTC